MSVFAIPIFIVVFFNGVFGLQNEGQRNGFHAPQALERGFAPLRTYFEKDTSAAPTYQNPNYGAQNVQYLPQAQALTGEPPQYGQPQVPDAISNYLAVVAQKYGQDGSNPQGPQQQGPQVFVPQEMQRPSPFRAPEQYQFVPPDPQQTIQQYQQQFQQQILPQPQQGPFSQQPSQFNQPEFANIQPAAQYSNHQPQYPDQQSFPRQHQQQQFPHQQSFDQQSALHQQLALNQQSQQSIIGQHPPLPQQYQQQQQVQYQQSEDLGQLPPITKNPNDLSGGEIIPQNDKGQNLRPLPAKFGKGIQFSGPTTYGDFGDLGSTDFEESHFGGFGGFGGFGSGKYGGIGGFEGSFDDISPGALNSFKFASNKIREKPSSINGPNSKRSNRYGRGSTVTGVRRPTHLLLSKE